MESLLTAVADYLARQSWQVAVVFVLVAATCYGLRKASAHWRYLLWLIVLAKCLTPGLVSVPLAVWPHPTEVQSAPVALPPPAATPRPSEMQLPAAAVPDAREMARATAMPVAVATEIAPHEVVATPKGTAANAFSARNISLRAWLVAAWSAGVAIFIGYVSLKAWSTHRRLRQTRRAADPQIAAQLATLAQRLGMKTAPAVYMVDAIAQPFVWGWFRGSIYVPRHFLTTGSGEHQQAIMAHELAHVARYDAAVNLLQIAVQALFFFHPLVWWTNRQIRRERENCCDETVIAGLGADPKQYGQAIVDTLAAEYEASQQAPSLAVTGRLKNVEERIETILSPNRTFFRRPSWAAVTAAVLLAMFVVPTALVLTVRGAPAAATASTPSEKTEKKPPAEHAAKKVADSSSDQPEPGGKSKADKDQKYFEGITVDSEGKPLAGVQVLLSLASGKKTAVSGPDGHFRLALPKDAWTHALLAESQDHALIGVSDPRTPAMSPGGPQPGKNESLHIVLKPARTLRVKVTTADGKPAAGVTVQAFGWRLFVCLDAQTGQDGQTAIRLPRDADVQYVVARKDDLGFDYYENYRSSPHDQPYPLPATVELRLHKVCRVRVRTIDLADQPVAGVGVYPQSVRLPGKVSSIPISRFPSVSQSSDASGVCDFAWLPADAAEPISFQSYKLFYSCYDEPQWDPAKPQASVTFRLLKDDEVSGTVRFPDGRPAAGIRVLETWPGSHGTFSTQTDADGHYRLPVQPRKSIIVAVSDHDWAAASHIDVRLDNGETRDHLDFVLSRGTRIHGRITLGAARGQVVLVELGERPEADAAKSGQEEGYRTLRAQVDDKGNYEFRVGPGRYSLRMPVPGISGGMADGGQIEIKVAGQPELVYDDTAAWPDKMRVSGRVVNAADGKPVAGAIVKGQLMGRLGDFPRDIPLDVRPDAQGRFSFARLPDKEQYGFYARVPESDLAGVAIVSSSASEVKVEVRPAVTVVGSVYDAGGKPVAGEQVTATLGISPVGLSSAIVSVVTDKSGRYRVPCLAVGSACHLRLARERPAVFGIGVPLDRPGEISARDLVLPADGPAPAPEAGQLHAVPPPPPAATSAARKKRPADDGKSSGTTTLTGGVAAPDGGPLADIPMRWWDWDNEMGFRGSHETQTDKTGRFRMTVPVAGGAVLWIYPRQYAPMQMTVEHQQADLGVLTMKKGFALSGTVLDADGKPVAGQWVYVQTVQDPARRGARQRPADMGTMLDRYARSNAVGKVTFDPLPPGDYLVGPSEGDRRRPGGGNPATPIQGVYYALKAKIEADGARPFELKALHAVKVVAQVYDSDGKKIAGGDGKKAGGREITCVGRNPGGVSLAWQTTGDGRDGRYEFLAPLGMEKAGLMFRPDERSSFRFRESADAPLRAGKELNLGTLTGDLTDIRVIRYVAPILLVKAADRAGKPIAAAELSARYNDASPNFRLLYPDFQKQNDGRYRSSSLLPDEKFTITVIADGYQPQARSVSLAEGTTSQLDLVLERR